MSRQVVARPSVDWSTLIDDAISGERLALAFQPVVDLQAGRITGYETLARFDGPTDAGPDMWFAAARQRGRADELDAAVVARALARWRTIPRNCFLTVNVEPSSLTSDALARTFSRAGRLDGLVLEVTEHVASSAQGVLGALDRYRAQGAAVAVDDAGSGYSGLQQILDLRPDFLKIDRALVTDIDVDEAKLALLDMLGALANHLDAWIIAEGVERPAEVAVLRDHGVPLAQGFFLALPGPPWAQLTPEAEALLAPTRDEARPALEPLLVPTPWIRIEDVPFAGRHLTATGEEQLVVIDANDRPVGTVDVAGAMDGHVRDGWKTNVRTALHDLAGRLATHPEPRLPELILCHDDEGRYVGSVRVQRLLAALATELRTSE